METTGTIEAAVEGPLSRFTHVHGWCSECKSRTQTVSSFFEFEWERNSRCVECGAELEYAEIHPPHAESHA